MIDRYQYHRDRLLRTRLIIQEAKSVPCMDCGIQYPFYVMDFDHVRGEKSFELWTAGVRKEETVRAEIAKCDIVCSNCHRMRTFKRQFPEESP